MDAPVPIAVIGVGCRLPGGASTPEKLEQLLAEGRSGWMEVPDHRWNRDAFYNPKQEAKEALVAKSGYFLHEDISKFDAKFFQIPPLEAHAMDPQQRILLETTYEALENAGIPLEKVRGSKTSVFVSMFARDYDRMGYKDMPQMSKSHITGTGEAILSNRISYVFDLKGVSLTLDTGCSGSLVALHQACQSLRLGESDMALVGGSQLLIHPDQSVNMSAIGMVNPDGRCYVFDTRGSGYSRGEGVATVLLKPLHKALADGDPVQAVIVNSGCNQDGKTAGISVPSGDAQATLMKSVYAAAGLDPKDTPYVEAHGTGTQIGDREEIGSIYNVFCESKDRSADLYVGSIKSNIGHLEASSGIAGLLKSIIILKTGKVPPHLDLETPKPSLKLDERRIRVAREPTPVFVNGAPRRVSLNSFGYGGTNCHVILEAPDSVARLDGHTANGTSANGHLLNGSSDHSRTNGVHANGTHANGSHTNGTATNGTNGVTSGDRKSVPRLFAVSAASEASVTGICGDLRDWISTHSDLDGAFTDLAYTLGVRRTRHAWRRVIVASSFQELDSKLGGGEKTSPPSKAAYTTPLTFVFTGQGAQWAGMGKELMTHSLRFKDSVSRSDKILRDLGCDWSLVEELARDETCSRLGLAEVAQPATTALQVALVDLLTSVGVFPERVVGHSSGEIGAAYAAGALSHEVAIEVAYHRGMCSGLAKQKNETQGSMLAVGIGEEEVLPYVKQAKAGRLTVACVNSPRSTTISGDEPAIDELKAALDAQSIFARKLKVDTAYHSHHMQSIASQYTEALSNIKTGSPRKDVSFFSTVTGARKVDDFGADYWTKNLVSPVQFVKGLELARQEIAGSSTGIDTMSLFVEIGPHSALLGPAKQILSQGESFKYTYLSALARNSNAATSTLELLGRLIELGGSVDPNETFEIYDKVPDRKVVVDLRPYAWDQASYWHESRISKDHRFRQFPYHDLCGLLDPASNIHEPRWRHYLNLDQLPWVRDHVVDGNIVFPGTGYICMALEAMRQLVQLRKTPGVIKNFLFNRVSFLKTISLPLHEDAGTVEMQLTISPSKSTAGGRWESFRIFSYDKHGTWIENCSGLVAVEMASSHNEVEGSREEDIAFSRRLSALEEIKAEATESIDSTTFYHELDVTGNHYGPNFALIDDVHIGGNKAWTKLTVPEFKKTMAEHHMQPHLIHPSVLDAIHQLGPTLFKRYCSNAPVVLGGGSDITISTAISSVPGAELYVTSTLEAHDTKSCTSDVCVFQEDPERGLVPVVQAKSTLRAFGEARQEDDKAPYSTPMAYKLARDVDVDFLSNQMFLERLAKADAPKDKQDGVFRAGSNNEETDAFVHCIEKASSILLKRALERVQADRVQTPHLVQLLTWMQKYCNSINCLKYTGGLNDREAEDSVIAAEESGYEGQMLSRIGNNLPKILTGEADALSLMLEGNLLYKLYANGLVQANYGQMVEYLKILTFKQPHMKFLEIGAGTGGATLPLLQSLTKEDGMWLDRYHYTDISAGFFDQARETFKDWLDYIDFRTLDIERDPVPQGFAEGDYDIIVAVNVLHATKNMEITMKNARRLLRPGGKLVLIELTRLMATSNLIFGTLPGWWAFEDGRSDSPLMSPEYWDALLKRTSFSGLEIIAQDTQSPNARSSMMVSQAVVEAPSKGPKLPRPLKIVQGQDSDASRAVASAIKGTIETAYGAHVSTVSIDALSDAQLDPEPIYIVLDLAEQTVLLSENRDVFERLKSLFNSGANIVWVAMQETDTKVAQSFKAMIQGGARVLRRENAGTKLITFDVEQPIGNVSLEEMVKDLGEVIVKTFSPTQEQSSGASENEYSYKSGTVYIPRIQTDTKFLSWVSRSLGSTEKVEKALYHQSGRPLKLEVATPGLLGSLRFVDDEAAIEPIKPSEIQVSSRAHGVNFKDVFVALGQMRSGVGMVGEVAGIVTAVGDEMKSRYKVGDRVAGFGSNPFASMPRISGYLAQRLPEGMPFAVGATIPAIYATSYYCIFDVARLRKGQSILIHAASGGVGQSAIQLAQHIGAEIFATVGSAAKRQLVVERYGIPESHVFSTRGTSFKDGVLRLTGGRGVDVVLNSLSGEMLSEGLECVARLGTFVEIGKADIYKSSHINMNPFDRSISFAAVDLVLLGEDNPERLYDILGSVMSLFEQGALYPLSPINTFPIGDIEEGFRLIATRKHMGKIVLEADPTCMVTATVARPTNVQLVKDGTYVVAGGLGDLGRRLGVFLSSKGAGHIVLLSRRTLDDESRAALEASVSRYGGKLHIVKCDITKPEYIQAAVDYCKSLPPVRGVIHGGMVLKDRPFTHMTYEDFTTPLGPKVYGTINLDDAFGSPQLDFFIMLSSVTTLIGNGSQANYATGNAFQDNFAHVQADHPHTRYISINVSGIEGSDSVNVTMQNNKAWLSRNSVVLMTFDEFFKSIEYSMSNQAREDNCKQSILGFVRQSMIDAEDAVLLSNPLFNQLPYPRNKTSSNEGGDKIDVEQQVRNAENLKDAEAIIAEAVIGKCAVFLDKAVDEVPINQSLGSIGLDSLVSIELKNWMARTFQITLQTSEIAGASSILALAATVASRSKLISDETRSKTGGTKPAAAAQVAETKTTHGFQCCKASRELPKYPLVDLDEALDDLLNNLSAFATNSSELEGLRKAVDEFRASGGLGRNLYDQLVQKSKDPNVDSWFHDLHAKGLYLSRRQPVAPWGSFLNTHHDSPKPHTQAERAAIISLTAFQFLKDIEADALEPDWLGVRPICTSSWKWLFNTVREPHVGCDEMRKYSGNHYCVVLRRGHVFKVPLSEGGHDISFEKLRKTFEAIVDSVQDDGLWTGILTTDDRDAWGTARDMLLSVGGDNVAYFQAVEAAAFVVCLDDGIPETREERVAQAYLGDGFNRWYDKGAQFLVSANGRSAQIFEHTMIDGLTIARLIARIQEAIDTDLPGNDGKEIDGHSDRRHDGHSDGPHSAVDGLLEEFRITTDSNIDNHILKLRAKYKAATAGKQYSYHTTPSLGTKFSAGSAVSAKACIDLAIQLASHLHFGYNPGSWEPVSTQHFHRGRPDLVQVATEPVARFCAAARDEGVPAPEKKALLVQAAKQWEEQVRRASDGKGFLRLLDILNGMVPADQPRPLLFTNEVVFRAFPGLVLQTINSGEIADVAIAPIPDEALWLSYSIADESVSLSIVGPNGKVKTFEDHLDKAAEAIRSILSA